MGFEPMISTLTGWRALRAAPRGHLQSENGSGGIRTLSISRSKREWSAGCLPSQATSSGGWNRTSGLHVQSVASLPAATTPESSIREGGFEPPPPDSKSGSLPVSRFPRASCGSRTRLSDLGSPCLAARPRTLCSLLDSRYQIPESKLENQSGIGDSNPGRLVGSQESCRWTNPASLRFRFRSGRRGS